ncbi:MAG: DNA-3-methyladenine glycosylase I [Alphaproteobacteria bacterium]|jgi:3-methyladenine DNA glycosylase Tag|nr:DNA-3-methyladenine glycosylase I [Rhodospirillales bacterium]MDP6588204.1 DNA-3-methyladenine glycosylase I [Alphaproteobacteria bacterium]MDP6819594.1 DNA-3-methyladenine glycosylase I [Alphaproteobacteria bacterium]
MTKFATIRETAERRAGGPAALKKLLPKAKSVRALKAVPDDRYLSMMSLRVFSAGLKHSMVAGKWPDFEEIFYAFEPRRVAAIADEDLEALLKEKRIIRHWGKIKATRHNAAALAEISAAHGGFGAWLAAWPGDDIVGLWDALQKRFSHLGGASGPYFLRMAGKDSFVLTADTVKALNHWGAFSGQPKGKKAHGQVQRAFNEWAGESALGLAQMSRILALSVD